MKQRTKLFICKVCGARIWGRVNARKLDAGGATTIVRVSAPGGDRSRYVPIACTCEDCHDKLLKQEGHGAGNA